MEICPLRMSWISTPPPAYGPQPSVGCSRRSENFPAIRCPEKGDFSWIGVELISLKGSYVSFLCLKIMQPHGEMATRELITGALHHPNATSKQKLRICCLSREYSHEVRQASFAQSLHRMHGAFVLVFKCSSLLGTPASMRTSNFGSAPCALSCLAISKAICPPRDAPASK